MQTLILSTICAFAIAILVGYLAIPLLRRLKFGQQVRDDGPETHLKKTGTPTMGGIIIWIALIITTLIFSSGSYRYVTFLTSVTLGFGLIGLIDDLIIVIKKRSLGLRAYQKIIGQFGLAIIVALFAYDDPNIGSKIVVPFLNVEWDLGIFYIPFTIFVVVSLVNAVNLTDGLDGLAGGVTLINSATFAVIFLAMSAAASAMGLTLYSVDLKNTMVFCAALTGACLGFLRFNSHPASVFMGDTGSLALGAAVSLMAIVSRMQFLIVITGLMFVLSALSVVIQVGYYKMTKKRVFKMAPLHHHFELSGMHETKVVALYMIITTVLCLIAMLVLV
ncbi:MAG: phospho-N-acetylmuramoyl-pentapeptide-transferase [Eubacteriales bacterium]